MPCNLTQGYNLDCRDSYGGVKSVFIMELANATTITQAAGVVTAITKATGKLFYKYNLVAFTGEGDETITPSRENGTLSVTQNIKFPINKMTVAVRNELLLLAKNRLLMVLVDNNGIGWLFGYENGMMLGSSSAKTGKALGDRNGYELAFEGMEKENAYQVDAATLLTLVTAGV